MSEPIDLDAYVADLEIARRRATDVRVPLALVVIARAAQAAGPWPRIDEKGYCKHCRAHVVHYSGWTGPHAPDCRGVALAAALERIQL